MGEGPSGTRGNENAKPVEVVMFGERSYPKFEQEETGRLAGQPANLPTIRSLRL
jgi:hypothetical protein